MNETSFDCLLTLAVPADLEEEVLDHLATHPQWVSGFTVTQAEGVGRELALKSTLEQVRGRSRRRVVQIVMRREHADALLDDLRSNFVTPELAWWLAPLSGFGRFG